jgi:hypothetical protein
MPPIGLIVTWGAGAGKEIPATRAAGPDSRCLGAGFGYTRMPRGSAALRDLREAILVAAVPIISLPEWRNAFMSARNWSLCLTAAVLLAASQGQVTAAQPSPQDKTPPQATCPAAEHIFLKEMPATLDIERKLSAPVNLNFDHVPLRGAVEVVGYAHCMNIYFDNAAMDAAGVDLNQSVSLKVEKVALKTALNLLLKQAKLTYVIKDQVVQITTEEEARGRLKQVTYPVADLVIPPSNMAGAGSEPERTVQDLLIKLITSTVAPDSWTAVGGKGTVQYFPIGLALVVNQTQDVQEQIADLLAALRRLQDVSVTLEARIITMPEELFAKVALLYEGWRECPAGQKTPGAAFLDDREVRQFLRSAQSSWHLNVLQAPKLTSFSGQTATITVNGKKLFLPASDNPQEFKIVAKPVVSADRRYIRLNLQVSLSAEASSTAPIPMDFPISPLWQAQGKTPAHEEQPMRNTQTVQRTVCIPDGQALMLGELITAREVITECDCPGFLWFRLGGDLCRPGDVCRCAVHGRQTDYHVLLVTPRIVINEPEAMAPPAVMSCPRKAMAKTAPCTEVVAPPATVLDNLEKLNKARQMMRQAEFYILTGHPNGARFALEGIQRLCPGSCLAEAATASLRKLHTMPQQTTEAAGEEQEPPTEVAQLVKCYQQACIWGQLREARRLALRALALDPACFMKSP